MAIIRQKDKKSGIIYVYEQSSHWVPELKQPRSKRRLIGKVDPDTGLVVPTGKVGRPRKNADTSVKSTATEKDALSPVDDDTSQRIISALRERVSVLEDRTNALEKERDTLKMRIQKAIAVLSGQ